jgi:hypothetical protein
MKARHILLIAAVFAGAMALWVLEQHPAAARPDTQVSAIRPFGT